LLLQAVKHNVQKDSRRKSFGTEKRRLQTVTKMVLLALGARVRSVTMRGCENPHMERIRHTRRSSNWLCNF
jgi:hypothetical protein